MAFIFFPSVIDNLIMAYTGKTSSFTMKALHLFITHSIGLINAIIYGCQSKPEDVKYKNLEDEEEKVRRGSKLSLTSSRSSRNSLQETLLKANASACL